LADKLTFIIPGKPQYITIVRLAVGSAANDAGFDVEEIEDIKNAVGEACKHISCHRTKGYVSQYEVTCIVEEGKIEILVTDISNGEQIEKLSRQCKHCPSEGELGLYIAKFLMNSVEVIDKEGRKTIRIVKAK
jgi:serine/threonine-protein kinase RsbW